MENTTIVGEQNPIKKRKRIVWIDQLRAVTFIFVIFGHALSKCPLKDWIYSFHMPLFFMITGLTLNIGKVYKTKFKDYFLKNFNQLMMPYFWLSLFLLPFEYIRIVFLKKKTFDLTAYLLGFVLANNPSKSIKLISIPLYFLALLFIAKLFLWLVVKISKGKPLAITGILLFVLCFGLVIPDSRLPWHLGSVPAAAFFIYLGKLLVEIYKKNQSKIKSLNSALYAVIILVLFAFGCLFNRFNGRISIHNNKYGSDFVLCVVCAVVTSVAIALIVMRLPKMKLLLFIGKNTLFYLGTHYMFVEWLDLLFPPLKDSLLGGFVKTVIIIFALIPIGLLFEKIAPYLAGNPIKKSTAAIEICKYFSILWITVVPFKSLLESRGGVLLANKTVAVCMAVVYVALCAAVTLLCNRFFPWIFMQKAENSASFELGKHVSRLSKNQQSNEQENEVLKI